MPTGYLIIVTGINGAGKESISTGLAHQLNQEGIIAERVYEPWLAPSATAVQRVILAEGSRPTDAREMLLYYAGIHAAAVQHINKRRAQGITVVADRGPETAWVYNALMTGLDARPWVQELFHELEADFNADLTLLLDLPVQEAMRRAGLQSMTYQFQSEAVAKHQSRRQHFLNLAGSRSNWAVVNAYPGIEDEQASINAVTDLCCWAVMRMIARKQQEV